MISPASRIALFLTRCDPAKDSTAEEKAVSDVNEFHAPATTPENATISRHWDTALACH
jgi:hypothetical protein